MGGVLVVHFRMAIFDDVVQAGKITRYARLNANWQTQFQYLNEVVTYSSKPKNNNVSRSERLQQMIDECLGGERSKKLLPDLRRELEAEQAKKESGEMQALRERAAAECRLADDYRRRYEEALKVKPVVEFNPTTAEAQPYWSVGNLVIGALTASAVWAMVMFN